MKVLLHSLHLSHHSGHNEVWSADNQLVIFKSLKGLNKHQYFFLCSRQQLLEPSNLGVSNLLGAVNFALQYTMMCNAIEIC